MAERTVREPIQVYLSPAERDELEEAARELGVSRSEALRTALRALRRRGYDGALRALVDDGAVTPARAGPGEPPPHSPVAPLHDLLEELAADRADRDR